MNPSLTYADLYQPKTRARSLAYNAMLVLGGSLLIAGSAQISIMTPFSPVPITGSTFGVLLVAALLGSKRGSLAVLAYLTEGLSGLPFFTMGRAGVAVLVGPTGGYLLGFLPAAYIMGTLADWGWTKSFRKTITAMAISDAVLFVFGAGWLFAILGEASAVAAGILPYLPVEIIKITLAAALIPVGWRWIKK